ncbi:MAG TPA: DUF4062 domain-containing protein [Anaerolineae bacterium]|nr:DUF4062 domain-containing protein [Anaerolineae bacterium]
MPTGSDGGKWALAGFLCQMLGLASITVRALAPPVISDGDDSDEVDALIAIVVAAPLYVLLPAQWSPWVRWPASLIILVGSVGSLATLAYFGVHRLRDLVRRQREASLGESRLLVFVSSVIEELLHERETAENTINDIPITKAWRFEHTPASADSRDDTYLSKVRECDIFVLIVGAQMTEPVVNEYATAKAHGKRRLVFLKDIERTVDAEQFVESIGREIKWAKFSDTRELESELRRAVAKELIDGYRRYRLTEAERRQLREFMAKLLSQRYADLERSLTDGCHRAVVDGAGSLLDLIGTVPDASLDKLQRKCHLLLAQAHLYANRIPDIEASRRHLASAARPSDDEMKVELGIVEALISYRQGKVDDAVSRLTSLGGNRAARVRFAMHVAQGQLDACQEILAQQEIEPDALLDDIQWGPYIAWFKVRSGEYDEGIDLMRGWCCRRASGRIFETSGHLHRDMAYAAREDFLQGHHIPSTFAIGLDLSSLVDRSALRQAAADYHRASQFYQDQHEPTGELLNLERAASLVIGDDSLLAGTLKQEIFSRLRQIDPDNILLHIQPGAGADAESPGLPPTLRTIENQIQRGADPFLLHQWIEDWIDAPQAPLKDYAAVLQEYRRQFTVVNDMVPYTWTTSEVLRLAGDEKASLEVLSQCALPDRYLYLRPLMLAMHSHPRGLSDETETYLQDACLRAPGNPLVLTVGIRFYASQERHDKVEELANRLIERLPTTQSYVWMLQSLLAQEKHLQFLERLDQASACEIAIPDLYSVLYRARVLVQLHRFEDARAQLETAYDHGLTEPADLCNLAQFRYQQGDRQQALVIARDLFDEHPDFVPGQILLPQLLLLEDQQEEAFQNAQVAAKRSPENEKLQLAQVELGFRAGRDKEASMALGRVAEHFPDSQLLRKVSLEELKDMGARSTGAAQDADSLYRTGTLPVLFLCYSPGVNITYFQLWHRATSFGIPLYVAPGDQMGDLEQLQATLPCPVVLDYPSLVSIWGLWRNDCVSELQKLFSRVYVPSSFREILTSERSKLAQFGQPEFERSLKEIERLVEMRQDRFAKIEADEAEDDSFGEGAALNFARRHKLLYLHDHFSEGEDPSPQATYLGLHDLAHLLFTEDYIDQADRDTLLEVCTPGLSLRADLSMLRDHREIVANLMTLRAAAQVNLLGPVVEFFERIYITRRDLEYVRGMIRGYEKHQTIWREFKAFTLMLENAGDFIAWVSPEDTERTKRRRTERSESERTEVDILRRYFFDLFLLAHETACPLMTDDRVTKMVQGVPDVTLRFGTDTLLRLLDKSGLIDHTEFVSLYGRLVGWEYRHLSPEPQFLLGVLPTREGESPRFTSAVSFYQRSLRKIVETAEKAPPPYRDQVIQTALRSFTDGMWKTLRLAHDGRSNSDLVVQLVKNLALPSFLDQFRARKPEYLAHLLGSVLAQPFDWLMGQRDPDDRFLEWLDEVLCKAGYEPEDIDLSWRYLIEELGSGKATQTAEDRHAVSLIMGALVEALPERTRISIMGSPAGNMLRRVYGLGFEDVHEFRVERPDGEVKVRVAESMLQDALEFVTRQPWKPGAQEIEHHGLAVKVNLRGMFASIEILPSDPAFQGQWGRGLPRLAHLIHWFDVPELPMRQQAWRAGRHLLQDLHVDTAKWDALAVDLESQQAQAFQNAGEACLDMLVEDRDCFSTVVLDAAEIGADAAVAALSVLKPAHVARWLEMEPGELNSKQSFFEWASRQGDKLSRRIAESQLAFQGSPSAQRTTMLKTLLDSVQPYLHSMFGDARLWRESLIRTIEASPTGGNAEQAIAYLLAAAEESCSRTFKANLLLAILDLCSRVQAPLCSTTDQKGEPSIAERMTRLFEQIVYTPSDVHGQEDRQYELTLLAEFCSVAVYARWLGTEQAASIESLRYLSAMAGGIVGHILAQSDALDIPEARSSLAAVLEQVTQALFGQTLWQRQWDEPGFYRPEWSEYLRYTVAFMVPDLIRHLPTVSTHLLNDRTRQDLLNIALRYRVHHFFLGDELEATWLDKTVDMGVAGGIDGLLREACGDSLELWPQSQQAQLESIGHFDDPKAVIDTIFSHLGTAPQDTEILLYLHVFSLGAYRATDRWATWMERWLDPDILERLQASEQLYDRFVRLASMVVLRARPTTKAVDGFGCLLLSTRGDGVLEHLLPYHASALVGLATWGWKGQLIGEWLESVTKDSQVDLAVRRKCIRSFTDSWQRLDPEMQDHIGPVLARLAEAFPFAAFFELTPFRPSDAESPEGTTD